MSDDRPGLRRSVAFVVLLVLTTAAAACQPDDEPTPRPEISTATSTVTETPTTEEPTEDPTPDAGPAPELEPPEFPEGADVDNHVGAALFATYILDLYGYIHTTGDLSLWSEVTSSECGWCSEVYESLRHLHEDEGGWIEGAGLTYDYEGALVSYPTESVPYYVVTIEVAESGFVVHLPGHHYSVDGAPPLTVHVAVTHVVNRFVVFEVDPGVG